MSDRIIKFRAWDKKIKKMYFVDAISFSRKEILVFDEEQDDTLFLKFKDAELIQYTGLKDEEDSEVYEGDLIVSDGRDLREVRYVCNTFVGISIHDKSSPDLELTLNEIRHRTVIGNICENPDLINE